MKVPLVHLWLPVKALTSLSLFSVWLSACLSVCITQVLVLCMCVSASLKHMLSLAAGAWEKEQTD